MKDNNLPKLFTPFKLKNMELRNRIAVPLMYQYVSTDGTPMTGTLGSEDNRRKNPIIHNIFL